MIKYMLISINLQTDYKFNERILTVTASGARIATVQAAL